MNYRSIDEYHASFPTGVRTMLDRMRTLIRQAAPRAEEDIRYNIPTFVMGKALVHYGAHARHIALYPTSSPMKPFARDLAPYRTSKGAIRFPFDKPLPAALIRSIVRFRVREIKTAERIRKARTMR